MRIRIRVATVPNRRSQMGDGIVANHGQRTQPTREWLKHMKVTSKYVPRPYSYRIIPFEFDQPYTLDVSGRRVRSRFWPARRVKVPYYSVLERDRHGREKDGTWESIRLDYLIRYLGLLELD